MRRPAPVLASLVCALVLLVSGLFGGTTAVRGARILAQDATPATAGAEALEAVPQIEGVTTEYLSNGVIENAAPDHVLELVRVTLAPGARVPEVEQAGGTLIFVEQGSVEVEVMGGVTERLVPKGGPAPAAREDGCGDGCSLGEGESVVLSEEPRYAVANPGNVEAVLLVSELTQFGSGASWWWCDRACRGPG